MIGSILFNNTPSTTTPSNVSNNDTLINSGNQVSSIEFDGGIGQNTFLNSGSTIGTLTFNGGNDDSNSFLNQGNNVSTINFTGGADANVFRNDGTGLGTVTFNGDAGSNYLLNDGSATSITLNGGADGSTLVNNGQDPNGLMTFNPGDGTNLFVNTTGSVLGTIGESISDMNVGGLIYNGSGGADTLVNSGILSNVTFNPGDGNNTLANTSAATLENSKYTGGSESDSLLNSGTMSFASFNGGTGADTLNLDGTSTNIDFLSGPAGGTFVLGPDSGTVSNITYTGGAGTDLFVNEDPARPA